MPDMDPSTRERIVTTLREKHSIPRAGTRSVLDALAAEGFTLIEGATVEYEGDDEHGGTGRERVVAPWSRIDTEEDDRA